MDATRYLSVPEPMVLLAQDLREQEFWVVGVYTADGSPVAGLMEVVASDGRSVGMWTDAAYRRRPEHIVRNIVTLAESCGFRIPSI